VQYTTNKFLLEWCRLRGEPMPKAKSDILQGLKIVLAGRVGRTKVEMEEFLERHSAELHAKIVLGSTTHVISSDNVVYKGSPGTSIMHSSTCSLHCFFTARSRPVNLTHANNSNRFGHET